MRRKDLSETYSAICAVLKGDDEYDTKFLYALVKNKHRMKLLCEEGADQMKQFEKTRMQIIMKYCTKDKEGKPVVSPQGAYEGTAVGMNPEYDAAMDKLDEERTAYLRSDAPYEIYVIKKEHLPKGTVKAKVQDAIYLLTEDTQADNVEAAKTAE